MSFVRHPIVDVCEFGFCNSYVLFAVVFVYVYFKVAISL